MTVGEMVESAIDVDALIPPAMRGASVSEVMERYSITVLGLLRDLGVWDAEVLECRCRKDDYECEAFYPVYGNWRDLGFKYGDFVNVIAVPKEE